MRVKPLPLGATGYERRSVSLAPQHFQDLEMKYVKDHADFCTRFRTTLGSTPEIFTWAFEIERYFVASRSEPTRSRRRQNPYQEGFSATFMPMYQRFGPSRMRCATKDLNGNASCFRTTMHERDQGLVLSPPDDKISWGMIMNFLAIQKSRRGKSR